MSAMRSTFVPVATVFVLAGSILSAQSAVRLEGRELTGRMQFDRTTNTTRDTATVSFRGPDNSVWFTVDFVAQYAGAKPTRPPSAIDVVVTEHKAGDEAPGAMTLQVNDRAIPVVSRAQGERSIVSTVTYDEFVGLANAREVVEQAFNAQLVLGAAPLRMLQATAARWSGQ